MNDYPAAEGRAEREIVINRSRFIATVQYVSDFDDAQKFVAEIKKKYQTATHNCYAFISNDTGSEQRFSDDGEPQGTAGQPMLEVLKKRNLRHTAVVVTRYFGGVKLGAGGLVSAYTRAVAEALDESKIVWYRASRVYEFNCAYTEYQMLQNALKGKVYALLNTVFGDNVRVTLAFPTNDAKRFLDGVTDALAGKLTAYEQAERYVKYDTNLEV